MRHQLTREEKSKGGRNQSREDKSRAGQIGFQVTMERHPYFARHHLKHKIKGTVCKKDGTTK